MLVASCALVGILGAFSILSFFLVLAAVLALAAPLRRRPPVFWAILAGVLGFVAGFILVDPLSCSRSATAVGTSTGQVVTQTTVGPCSNLLGIRFGAGSFSPSLLPGLVAGAVLGLVAAVSSATVLAPRTRT